MVVEFCGNGSYFGGGAQPAAGTSTCSCASGVQEDDSPILGSGPKSDAKEAHGQRMNRLVYVLPVIALLAFLEAGNMLSLRPEAVSLPTSWSTAIDRSDLLVALDDRKPLHTLRASIGNGYVAMTMDSKLMYVAGLFNGPAVSQHNPAHRAAISAPLDIRLHGGGLRGSVGALDLRHGRYTRSYFTQPSSGSVSLEQSWYAHRSARFKGVMVMEVPPTKLPSPTSPHPIPLHPPQPMILSGLPAPLFMVVDYQQTVHAARVRFERWVAASD